MWLFFVARHRTSVARSQKLQSQFNWGKFDPNNDKEKNDVVEDRLTYNKPTMQVNWDPTQTSNVDANKDSLAITC